MKQTFLLAIGLSVLLVGCGDNDEANNVPDNAPVEEEGTNNNNNNNSATNNTNDNNNNNNNNAGNTADTYNFTHFGLEVDYPNNKKYEVEYENESTGAEASIDDEVNNNRVQGNDAIDQLLPLFESLKFDSTTAEEDVLNQVIETFNINNDYTEIELDVEFADGTKKEYRKMQ